MEAMNYGTDQLQNTVFYEASVTIKEENEHELLTWPHRSPRSFGRTRAHLTNSSCDPVGSATHLSLKIVICTLSQVKEKG